MSRHRKHTSLYVVRLIRGRPRLFFALAVGITVAGLTPAELRLVPRLLAGWDVFIGLYLVLTGELMMRSHVSAIRGHAAIADEGRIGILVLTSGAALASFGAILGELGSSVATTRQPRQIVLAIATILLSWSFTHTIFALHYAHEFYRDGDRQHGGGLVFPGGEPPDYWDFVYFSFVIGMTSQVSDVAISDKWIRRTATAHGVLAFIFNTAILALTVNIAASAL